jgi:hypothetical protein
MRRLLLSLAALSVMVVACGGSGGEGSEGLRALRQARLKARSARFVVVLQGQGLRLELTPRLTVTSRRGRILNWETADVEYTPRRGRDCYERYTEFLHADTLEVRRNIVAPKVDEARVERANGRTVIRWRIPRAVDAAAREGEVYLDRRGRPVLTRERSLRWGAIPPSRWSAARFRYPTRLEVPPPGPRCR